MAPAIELMLTMLPPPASFIASASSRTQRKAPVRLTSITRWNSSVRVSRNGDAVPVPAAFTARFSAPRRSTVAATRSTTDFSSVTSQTRQVAWGPSFSAACFRVSSRRAQSMTRPPPATMA